MMHSYDQFLEKNNYKIINCKSCGFWHVYPIPSVEELNTYYEKTYYNDLSGNRSMTDKQSDPDGFYRIQYEDRLRQIEKVLPPGLSKSVIDIGAGYGDFLKFLNENGWETQGIEPSGQSIEDENLNIKSMSIDNLLDAKLYPASVITLNNVLEHLRNPRETLNYIQKEFLLEGGIISVVVPNDFSITQEILSKTVLKNNKDKQHYWIVPPEHINYWSIETFKTFLEGCGLKIISLTVDFPMELFPLFGDNYITDPEVGRVAHLKRVKLEKSLFENNYREFKDLLYQSFASIGIGRDIHAIVMRSSVE